MEQQSIPSARRQVVTIGGSFIVVLVFANVVFEVGVAVGDGEMTGES